MLGTYGGRYRRDRDGGGDATEQYVYRFSLQDGVCIDAEVVCNELAFINDYRTDVTYHLRVISITNRPGLTENCLCFVIPILIR
eukprot:COSAG01_NODE_10899_length_2056_cov_1.291262_2_plen_84_part_00